MKFVDVQKKIIILGLLLVPILSLSEVFALFRGQLEDQTSNISGLIKFSKDIIFLLLILVGFFYFLFKSKLSKKGFFYFIVFICIVIPSILMSVTSGIIMIFAGLRWLVPVILIFFISNSIDEKFLNSLIKILIGLFIFHFVLQILQAFFASAWYGVNALGLNARNPGLFLIPNTGAFFSLIILYFILYLSSLTVKSKILSIPFFFISVMLTLSGTGFLLFFLIIFFWFFNLKFLKYLPLIIVLIIPFFIYSLDLFLSRGEGYVENSGGGRLKIFIESFDLAGLFSNKFGMGTNSYVMLGGGTIMDSLYASVVLNLGIFGLFFLFSLIIFSLFISIYMKDKALFVFVLVISIYSATTILFEAYPMNLLTAIIFIIFYKKYKIKLS